MTERSGEFHKFDSEVVTAALGVEPTPTRDVAFGEGHRFAVGAGRAELEIFPAAGVARVTTRDARLELHRLPGYTTHDETHRVVFEQGDQEDRTRLTIRDDGRVSFHPVQKASEGLQGPRPDDTAAQATTPPVNRLQTTTAADGTPAGADREESAEQPTEQLRGRLGRDPWFSGDAHEPIGGFPLAVNDEASGQTTWHKIVAFGDTAASLQEGHRRGAIRKGRLVDVVGRAVVEEEPKPGGGTRRNTQFHAESIERVTSSSGRRPSEARPAPQDLLNSEV